MDTDINIDKRVAAQPFINWVLSEKSGIFCPNVQARYSPVTGFGLIARRNIMQHDHLIKIPKRMIITESVIRSISEYDVLLSADGAPSMSNTDVLILFYYLERFFLDERHKNIKTGTSIHQFFFARCLYKFGAQPKDSETGWVAMNRNSEWFRSYFNILPRKFNTPLELCCENGIVNWQKLNQTADLFPKQQREILHKQVVDYNLMAEKMQTLLDDAWNPSLFLWAWHIYNTRCVSTSFPGEDSSDSISMIPFFDLINHSTTPQCVPRYYGDPGIFCVYSEYQMIVAGSEVHICYGPHDNARLWLEYGFMLHGENIYNRVDISTDLFIRMARSFPLLPPLSDDHEQVIREAGFPCTIYGSDQEPGYGLRNNCRMALLKRSQLSKWESIIFHESDTSPDEEQIAQKVGSNDRNVHKMTEVLLIHVLRTLQFHLQQKVDRAQNVPEFRRIWREKLEIINALLSNSEYEGYGIRNEL